MAICTLEQYARLEEVTTAFQEIDDTIEAPGTVAWVEAIRLLEAYDGVPANLNHVVLAASLGCGDGKVYFIGTDDAVKIGTTKNVRNRLEALQSSSPAVLTPFAVIRGNQRLEYALHQTFKQSRLHGEWFMNDFMLAGLIRFLGGNTASLQRMP